MLSSESGIAGISIKNKNFKPMTISQKKRSFIEITQGFSAHLKFLSELGVPGVDCSAKTLEILNGWGDDQAETIRSAPGKVNPFIKCQACSMSKSNRQMVCGEGASPAKIAIVGGAASMDDEIKRKPYTGRSGDLLDKMLGAMNLTRGQVYITRAVKCCPPDGRKPALTDIKACRSYLLKELAQVRPPLILAFGEIAAMSLLETSMPLSRLRGRFHDFQGMRVMPTYSPERLLEDPGVRRDIWEDLKQVMADLK